MKKIIYIIIIIIIGTLGYVFFSDNLKNTGPVYTDLNPFLGDTARPVDIQYKEPITEVITNSNGQGSLQVSDFVNNGYTIEDSLNPGNYILAGPSNYCSSDGVCEVAYPTDEFKIVYMQRDDFFNVLIYSEPILEVRKEAEKFLQEQLGLSEGEMCDLNYSVTVSSFINRELGGLELGFSFCSGSFN